MEQVDDSAVAEVEYSPVTPEDFRKFVEPNPGPSGGSITGADLSGVCFKSFDLRGKMFTRCDLTSTDFSRSNLSGAKFDRCVMDGTLFIGAHLPNVMITGCKIWDVDFSDVRRIDGSTLQVEVFELLPKDRNDMAPIMVAGPSSRYPKSIEGVTKISRMLDDLQGSSPTETLTLKQSEILVLKKLVAVFEAFSAKDGGVS